jgi:DNA-binding transcriptional LysR family regulator
MTDLDLITLRLFVAVCDARSIQRVAEREKLDRSAITKRLAKLEDQLNTKLIKRVGHGVQPTPEGMMLCEYAKNLLIESEKITSLLKHKNVGYSGTITIASSSSNVGAVLTNDLASFMALSEQSNIQMVVKEMMVSKDVVQAVRDGVASLGIIWDNTETSDLQTVNYTEDQLAVVAPQGHPLSALKSVDFKEVLKYELVATKNTRHTEALLRRSGGIGSDLPNMRIRVEVDLWESGLKIVAHGIGVMICSANFAEQYAGLWDFVVIPIKDTWAKRKLKICYKNSLQTALSERLIKHLVFQHHSVNLERS